MRKQSQLAELSWGAPLQFVCPRMLLVVGRGAPCAPKHTDRVGAKAPPRFPRARHWQVCGAWQYLDMADLAHYEWVELELELAVSVKKIKPVASCNILKTHWQLSGCAKLLNYEYDVHNIGSSYIPNQTIPTFLTVYKKDNAIEFMVLNELSFQLLQCIIDNSQTPYEVLESIVEMYPNVDFEQLASQIQPLIEKLHQEGILLGMRTN